MLTRSRDYEVFGDLDCIFHKAYVYFLKHLKVLKTFGFNRTFVDWIHVILLTLKLSIESMELLTTSFLVVEVLDRGAALSTIILYYRRCAH